MEKGEANITLETVLELLIALMQTPRIYLISNFISHKTKKRYLGIFFCFM
ncbi:hypothetical protein [Flavobacterium sp. ZS1P14]